MWTVRTNSDGTFRSANKSTVVCFTLAQWRHADPAAAGQFIVPDDVDRDVQIRFMRACGL